MLRPISIFFYKYIISLLVFSVNEINNYNGDDDDDDDDGDEDNDDDTLTAESESFLEGVKDLEISTDTAAALENNDLMEKKKVLLTSDELNEVRDTLISKHI